VAAVAHWTTTALMGLIAAAFWRRLFPGMEHLSLSAACLAITPVFFQLGHVLLNPVFGGAIGSVCSYLALLLLLANRLTLLRAATAVTLIFVAVLLSEYGVVPLVAECACRRHAGGHGGL
jgi:hypothetical protein